MKKITPFDAIIACGDSFTHGERDQLNIELAQTWPAILAKKLNVPFENLGILGADNYNISLQPYLHQRETYNAPLYVFNFTVDYRLPYFCPNVLTMGSLNSILPEDITKFKWGKAQWGQIKTLLSMRIPNIDLDIPTHQLVNHTGLHPYSVARENTHLAKCRIAQEENNFIDGFAQMTKESILQAHRITRLVPNAQVIWGFIHGDYPNGTGSNFMHRMTIHGDEILPHPIKYPHLENCYNTFFENKLLQEYVDGENLWISEDDSHPNIEGITLIAELMYTYICQNVLNSSNIN